MGSLSLTAEQETCSELSSWSAVWHTPQPKPGLRLTPTTDTDTPDWDMVGLDTPGLDTPDWDTMASVRLRLSLKLRLIPTTDTDTLVLDMLVLDTPGLDTPGLDTLDLDTLA